MAKFRWKPGSSAGNIVLPAAHCVRCDELTRDYLQNAYRMRVAPVCADCWPKLSRDDRLLAAYVAMIGRRREMIPARGWQLAQPALTSWLGGDDSQDGEHDDDGTLSIRASG